ncbi:flagellar protein FlaG [Cupriavidus agavae]|uniref:Flagellar protein FlaG n=1 Tax=Cupriavidus agavae TaxID=1001822 RepID=A0A4Q7RE17_9BURK|nr:flagellar protein FlaG [Cupriavidus agavae]RZT30837.1 flagellar protein FlaG [Cupriavidus agavae]
MAFSSPVSLTAARVTADFAQPAAAQAMPAAASSAVPAAYGVPSREDATAQLPPGTSADMAAAVGELVDVLKTTSIGVRFEIDQDTNRVITKVVDKETGELIRQLPSEEVLRFARVIDKLQGLFVSQKA